jgi:hypothetical protein
MAKTALPGIAIVAREIAFGLARRSLNRAIVQRQRPVTSEIHIHSVSATRDKPEATAVNAAK